MLCIGGNILGCHLPLVKKVLECVSVCVCVSMCVCVCVCACVFGVCVILTVFPDCLGPQSTSGPNLGSGCDGDVCGDGEALKTITMQLTPCQDNSNITGEVTDTQ